MKKRLLSMLLLVVMLVSAVPFVIFASAAEAATEEEPYDYNALYVAENLILAFDIMASNGFGGAELEDFPQSPMTMTAYKHGTDTYDFTNIEERYDYSGRYFVMKEKNGNKLADYSSGVHLTLEAAEAAMETAKGKDKSGYTWSVEGPYNYLILRATKKGELLYDYTLILETVYNQTGYTAPDAAELARDTLEEIDEEGGDKYQYFVIGSDTNAAYQAAGKAYTTAVNAWLAKYQWASTGPYLSANSAPSNHANALRRLRDSMIVYAPIEDVTEGDGFIVRKYPYCADWGIQIDKLPQANALSAQMVSRWGQTMSGNFLILANVRHTMSGNAVTKTTDNFTSKADTIVSNPFDPTSITSMTFTLTGGITANGDSTDCDSYSIVTPNGVLYSAEGIYVNGTKKVKEMQEVVKKDENGNPVKDAEGNDVMEEVEVEVTVPNDTALNTANIIGHRNSAQNAELYAIRYYDRALTADEINRNHFADIAKWYQLDMALYEALNADQKTAAQAEIIAFVASNDAYSFSADATARNEIQNKLDTFALETIYNQLTDAPESFKTIAKGVRADISGVLALPVEYRDGIYAAVLALNPGAQKDPALVQATIAAEIDRVLNLYYGMYMNTTTMTYKDIYVHKDNLVIWADFFAAKASDGYLYADHSYTDELTPWDPEKYGDYNFVLPQLDLDADGNVQYEANGTPKYKQEFNANGSLKTVHRRAVKGDMVPNWHLPSIVNKATNPDKIKIPQTSNMAEAYAKYVFKGAQTASDQGFHFYDLPNTGYGHTNIREYGDGCLIGGLNNSLKVFSPGIDVETVTYQFVTNVKGNLQLDGYRASTVLKNGSFYIDGVSYYSYGVGTDGYTLSNSALQSFKPNKKVNAGSVMDLTVTLDKKLGEDAGHYYTEVYVTNNEGAIKYYDDAAQKDLYRYAADGAQYLCQVNGDVYTALYTVNAVGNKFYITHDEKPVKSVQLVKGEDGSFTVDWETAVYEEVTEETVLGASAEHVNGPYYQNPFPEVSSETPGATGPIVYKGTYDLGVYANGEEYLYLSSIPYSPSDIGSVGNSGDLTVYAIRTYNIVLTEDEIRQNHFADLAGFYGLDLAPYALLNAEQKTALHKRLCGLELGLSKSEGKRVYQEAIDAVFYNFDTAIEGAGHFLAICHAFGLDTSSLAQLSPEAQARVFAKFADVDDGAHNYTAILQKNLVDAVSEEINERYAAAFGHNTIAFDGWQLHQTGDYGLRALFSTDIGAVNDLKVHGATVKTGLLTAEKSDTINNLDALKVSVGADGTVTAPDGVTLVQGYWNGTYGEGTELVGNSLRFTEEYLLGLEDAEDDEIAKALEGREFLYVGFSVVEYETDAGKTYTVFYEDATLAGKAGAYSVYELSSVAKYDYKIATKNIQTAMNLCEDEAYISASVGNTALETYLLVRSAETEILDAVQASVEAALGFQLNMVRNADVVAGGSGYIHIGTYDNLHATKCYGISTFGGNIYIWANVDAEITDAVALFTDYIELQLANGADAVFEENVEIVCRAR